MDNTTPKSYNRPVHFEIHQSADMIEKGVEFYTKVFGWNISKYPMPDGTIYYGVDTGKSNPGIGGGIIVRQGPKPTDDAPIKGCTIMMQVENLDATWKIALDNGARVALEPARIPMVGRFGYLIDLDGNVFAVIED